MSRYSKLLLALVLGFVGTGGCSSRGGEDSSASEPTATAALALESTGIAADIVVSPFTGGFNATVTVRNTGAVATSDWQVDILLTNATASSPWNATYTTSGNVATFSPASYVQVIEPGGSRTFGFNGTVTGSGTGTAAVAAVRRDGNSSGGSGGTTSSGGSTSSGGTSSKGGSTSSSSSGSAVTAGGAGTGGSTNPGIALDKPASASSYATNAQPSYGNDTSLTTKWCANTSATGEWWTVDLGANYNLTGSEVTWEYAGRSYQYQLAVSTDNQSFTVANDQSGNSRTTQTQTDNFSATGRYVRVTVTGLTSSPATTACFYDLKLFGTAANTTGSGGSSGVGSGGAGSTQGGAGGSGQSSTGSSAVSGGAAQAGGAAGSASTGGANSTGGSAGTAGTGTTPIDVDRRKFFIRLPGGVRRQDVAVGSNGGPVFINDGVSVVRADGTYASVTGTNLVGASRIGVDAQVQNAWLEGNITLTNRTWVHGVAKSTGAITKDVDTKVTGGIFEQFKFTTPEVIAWDVDFPWSATNSVWLQPTQQSAIAPGSYDVAYVPQGAKLHLSAGTYTFNRMTVEDLGILELDNSAGPIFIHLRDAFTFRGIVNRAVAKGNVLFGVAGVSTVFVERAFTGIVVAPWAPISVTSAVEHRGAFFGNGVTIHQQSKLVLEALDPTLFCAQGAACSSFCPCGGDTCGESTCGAGETCGKNMGPRFGRAAGTNVCWSSACDVGGGPCGAPTEMCGSCENPARICTSDADCPAGDICGQNNGPKMGLVGAGNVCWSAVCATAPNVPPNCGDKDAACGYCDCSDVCASKSCGDDPSDGCGGTCTGLCENGQGGCTQSSDCPVGSICGMGIGSRFGLGSDVNVCWPATCELQDPAQPNGGVDSYSCGVAPACIPECDPGSSEPDGCGGFCGECESDEERTPTGDCSPVLDDVWNPSPDVSYSTLAQGVSAPQDNSSLAFPRIQPPESNTAGTLAGNFAVTDKGEAAYTVPITVPPGRLGVQPSLSFSYRSNKVNGMLGLGWALGGLSTISRCPWIVGREGRARPVMFDKDDRFCLDGNALIKESDTADGAIYRTEIATFSKIVMHLRPSSSGRYFGPAYFEVFNKDGRILKYGNGGRSIIRTSTDVGRVWALRSVEDRYGNLMVVRYLKQSVVGEKLKNIDSGATDVLTNDVDAVGELVPDVISYAGNRRVKGGKLYLSRFVRFNYTKSRPDPVMHYQWGVKGYSRYLLVGVDTFVGQHMVRKYKLRYDSPGPGGVSQVSNIQECGVELGVESCTPATFFGYEPEKSAWGAPTKLVEFPMGDDLSTSLAAGKPSVRILDIDADGRGDVLAAVHPGMAPGGKSPRLGTAGGFPCALLLSSRQTSEVIRGTATTPACAAMYESKGGPGVLDVNGDGRDDLVYHHRSGEYDSDSTLASLVATGATSGDLRAVLQLRNTAVEMDIASPITGDFDGNGFVDILVNGSVLWNRGVGGLVPSNIDMDGFRRADATAEFSRGRLPVDVNGDGSQELCEGLPGSCINLVSGASPTFRGAAALHLNLNGDALGDPVWSEFVNRTGGGLAWVSYVGLQSGRGIAHWMQDLPGSGGSSSDGYSKCYPAADGSGREKLICPGSTLQWNAASQRAVWSASPSSTLGTGNGTVLAQTSGDLDGDGSKDLVWIEYGSAGALVAYSRIAPDNARAGLLRSIWDGVGKRTVIEYEQTVAIGSASSEDTGTTTDPVILPVYTRTASCIDRQSSHCKTSIGPVVSYHREDQVSDLSNGVLKYGPYRTYTYQDARTGTLGRNWFAFTSRSIYNGLGATQIDYVTDPPDEYQLIREPKFFSKIGKPKRVSTTKLIGSKANAFSGAVRAQSTVWNATYETEPISGFYYPVHSTSRVLVNDSEISRTETSQSVDTFGNVVASDRQVIQGQALLESVHVNRLFDNDTSGWLLGKMRSESVVSTVGGTTRTRTMGYAYDAFGGLKRVVREPNGFVDQAIPVASNPYLRTVFDRDDYGNVFKVSTSDRDERNSAAVRVVDEVTAWDEAHIYPLVARNAMGHETTIEHAEAFGLPVKITDENGAELVRDYDALGRLIYSVSPSDSTTLVYEIDTPRFAETGQSLPVWSFLRVQSTTVGSGTTTTSFDAFGRMVRQVRPGYGNTCVEQDWEYDGLGRLSRESLPHGFVGDPRLAGVHDPSQGTVKFGYAGHRLTSIEQPGSNVVRRYYTDSATATGLAADWIAASGSASGQVHVKAAGNIEARFVNGLGQTRLTIVGSAAGADMSIAQYEYGPFGVPRSVIGPKGTTMVDSDILGRPEVITDSATGVGRSILNGYGEAILQQDGRGETTLTDYDLLGRATELRTADGGIIAKWTYDGSNPGELGQLVASYRQAMPNEETGNWTRYRYTAQGLPKGMDYRIGGLSDEVDSGELYSFEYNYDSLVPGRVVDVDYPSAAGTPFGIHFNYADSGSLTSVASRHEPSIVYWQLLEVDQGIRPTREQYGNGTVTTTEYYALDGSGNAVCQGSLTASCVPGSVKSIKTRRGQVASAELLFNEGYSYNANGNLWIASRAEGAVVATSEYEYDAQDRLKEWLDGITVPVPQFSRHSYRYDNAGNLLANGTIADYAYDPAHPFQLEHAGGTTHQWDDAGNLKRRSGDTVPQQVQVFDYNDFSMPYRVTNGTGDLQSLVELEYDADGSRVVKRTKAQFDGEMRTVALTLDLGELYQQDREFDRQTGTGEAIQKVHHFRVFAGNKQVAEVVRTESNGVIDWNSSSTKYIHHDRLGSAVMATDEEGDIAYKQKFDPFGAVQEGSGNWNYKNANSGFTGHQHDDDLGLINMRGRLYDPRLGRFTKADPFVTTPYSPKGLNRYSYVLNNPLNFTDPSGFEQYCYKVYYETPDGPGSADVCYSYQPTPQEAARSDAANQQAAVVNSIQQSEASRQDAGRATYGGDNQPRMSQPSTQPPMEPTAAPPTPYWPINESSRGSYGQSPDAGSGGGTWNDYARQGHEGRPTDQHSPLGDRPPSDAEVDAWTTILTAVMPQAIAGIKMAGKEAPNPSTPGKMQKEVERGQAPKGVSRVDKGQPPHEKDHVHFGKGERSSALNSDGTWKHNASEISNAIRDWLTKHGWTLPE